MTEQDDADADYRALLDRVECTQLATLGADGSPQASHAPCVRHDGDYFLFLSALSGHTANLKRDARVGLLLLEDADAAPNPFARPRVSLRGKVEIIARDSALFPEVLADFRQRFGEIVQLLESLPDFTLFRVRPESGSFIRGFGQAYALEGPKLDRLRHIDPHR